MVQQCRILNLTVALVIGLSIYNILLTVKLLSKQENVCQTNQAVPMQSEQKPPQVQQEQQEEQEQQEKQPCRSEPDEQEDELFAKLDLKLGRWDNRLLYKYYDNFVVGESVARLSERFSVCLATQSSLDKLHSLPEVSRMWHGAISAALFASGEEELHLLLLYVVYLRRCYAHVRQRVSFHLALPGVRIPPGAGRVHVADLAGLDCNAPDVALKMLAGRLSTQTTKWRVKHPYPQNHLRNLARKNCNSKHVFLTDVDVVPSRDFVEQLDRFLGAHSCAKKCAYVVPTYELDDRVQFPANKTELVRLANKGLARPFHHRVFIYNQYATNFTRWQNDTQFDASVHVSHKVTNFEFLYEPFYVAVDDVPPHDERFIGYGYTRNTQVYEMFVADYEFLVLSPIFTVHWGLQVKRSRPPWREHQNNQNRKLFDTFKREVFARYKKDPLHMIAAQLRPA